MEPTTTFFFFEQKMGKGAFNEHEVIFQELLIVGIEPKSSISQTLKNESMTTRPTTSIVTTTHFFYKGRRYNI